MTRAQIDTLELLAWVPEVWWHDLKPRTRDALRARGWIRVARRVACVGHGHTHPGYVTISLRGLRALAATGSHNARALLGAK